MTNSIAAFNAWRFRQWVESGGVNYPSIESLILNVMPEATELKLEEIKEDFYRKNHIKQYECDSLDIAISVALKDMVDAGILDHPWYGYYVR